MDCDTALNDLEHLYGRVLELTREQEICLRAGNFTCLPSILERKTAALTRAQGLTTHVMGAGTERNDPDFQQALNRIGAILAQTVSAEDRCKSLVPQPDPPPDRRRAAAAYGSPGPRR